MTTINLSLVSHTNVGKTTLMRTLTRQDIGEVADRPHVTEEAESHVLIDTPQGDRLLLWDTPGFGDSARLLKRLRGSANPISWLLTQVWDRFTDRPFFCSQRAIRNVSEESDVVLYLVNAAEEPAAAGYAEKELEILGWIGKPVVVLLNQMGPTLAREAEALEEARWSRHLAAHVTTREAIALDAFARCWVQEDRLLGVVGGVLAVPHRPAFERLRQAWRARNVVAFDAAMRSIATQLAAAAIDRETAGQQGTERTMNTLERRLVQAVRENTDQLIALHGLSGHARERVLARIAGQFKVDEPVDAAAAGAMGGILSGALGGLAADLASGGITLGAGALIGAILGGLGVGGAAHAYNQAHGARRWSAESLTQHFAAAILRYLAVAHYGRGRGDWVEGEYPAHWRPLVADVAARYRGELEPIWNAESRTSPDEAAQLLSPLVSRATREVLEHLYPEARELFGNVSRA